MFRETGLVLDHQGLIIYWHLPVGRTGGSLPEAPELWDFVWANRKNVSGIAHSHPGAGTPGPSYTDVTTFAAFEAALGRPLDWWITTSDSVGLFRWEGTDWATRWNGPERLSYRPHAMPGSGVDPSWVSELRRASEQM